MDTPAPASNSASSTVSNDVLHLGTQSKLSPEQIAKALAHHNKHHHGDQPQQAAAKVAAAGKKRR
jgi:hypothetical protein